MNNENYVIFKGRKNGINIILNDSVDFDTLKDNLEKKIIDSGRFFEHSKTAISFSGRKLSEFEEAELIRVISEKSDLNISFVHDVPKKKIENDKKELISYLDYLVLQQDSTKYYRGAIRSGHFIKYDGSIVVIGDVNPGAQIVASGNIIVLGSLKGIVHAGCDGNFNSFIAAVNMIPFQLRIADIFTRFPDDIIKRKEVNPCKAYISDNKIYIEPLINITPDRLVANHSMSKG